MTGPTPGDGPPVTVLDIELHKPLRALRSSTAQVRVWLLVRFFTEPIGALLLDVPPDGISRADLAAAIDRELGAALRPRLSACGLDTLPVDGAAPGTLPPYLVERRAVLADAPPITVVVGTRNRPGPLVRCLDSLARQQYPRYRVLVVDHAPVNRATERLVDAAAELGLPVRYLHEPQPALPATRRLAAAQAPDDIVAFLDDDAVADPYWLAEIARALAANPHADAVCGAIVPAELDTRAQLWCARGARHGIGRGFTPTVFPSPAGDPPATMAALHHGGNMAFRPGVLARVDGGDTSWEAGGPGSSALGCDDSHAFRQVLLSGGTVVYQPGALVRHHHPREPARHSGAAEGETMAPADGMARLAAYTALVLTDPRRMWPLLAELRAAVGRGLARYRGAIPATTPPDAAAPPRRRLR